MNRSGNAFIIARSRALHVVLCSAVFLFAIEAQAQSTRTRHVRQEVANGQASRLNRLPGTQALRLNIALPLRNEAELDALLQQLYDPQSPMFRQFLSVQEFTDRFGPTEADYAALFVSRCRTV